MCSRWGVTTFYSFHINLVAFSENSPCCCPISSRPESKQQELTMAEEPKQSSFRVIIVGGGPVALTAAHIFDRIGVDYVILERWHALDVESGASLALWPHNVRLLDQLGLLKEAEASYQPVHLKRNLRRDGSQIAKNDMFDAIERK